MDKKENILNELKPISKVVATIGNKNIFTVPENYFNNLANNVLINTIANQDAKNELAQLSPLLSSINKAPIFTLPNSYLDSVASKTMKQQTQKSKPLGVSNFFNYRLLKYAVAACCLGFLAFAGYKMYFNQNRLLPTNHAAQINEKQLDHALALIETDDIIYYLKTNGDNDDIANLADDLLYEKETSSTEDYLDNDVLLDNLINEKDTNDFKN
jgi:hypothetical protein